MWFVLSFCLQRFWPFPSDHVVQVDDLLLFWRATSCKKLEGNKCHMLYRISFPDKKCLFYCSGICLYPHTSRPTLCVLGSCIWLGRSAAKWDHPLGTTTNFPYCTLILVIRMWRWIIGTLFCSSLVESRQAKYEHHKKGNNLKGKYHFLCFWNTCMEFVAGKH